MPKKPLAADAHGLPATSPDDADVIAKWVQLETCSGKLAAATYRHDSAAAAILLVELNRLKKAISPMRARSQAGVRAKILAAQVALERDRDVQALDSTIGSYVAICQSIFRDLFTSFTPPGR